MTAIAVSFADPTRPLWTNQNARLAAKIINGRLASAQLLALLPGLTAYDRVQVLRHAEALAVVSPRSLTADQKTCLDWLEDRPTDTADVDSSQWYS